MNWYLQVLKNYAQFNGRARRQEYWMFTLFHILFIIAAAVIDYVIFGSPGALYGIYALATLVPSLAVSVRRMHDIGKSGWMILVGFVPFIGGIWLLVLAVTEGEHGDNQYGPDPKAGGELAIEEEF